VTQYCTGSIASPGDNLMPTAAFTTLGCKVNQYETQRILDDFEESGFAITEFDQPADVYVINTCSVTQAAERKSRTMIRKVASRNPNAAVVMTGCYAEMAQIKGEAVEEASLIVPNQHKLKTLQYVLDAYPRLAQQLASPRLPPNTLRRPAKRTRATIKVQDGCNVFCSFCSIPYTRKLMLSRPLAEIVAEAERKAEQGYREIVITGVLVGAYGHDKFTSIPVGDLPRIDLRSRDAVDDTQPDLAVLLLRLAQVPGIERVRLSSIEPTQVTDRLLAAFMMEPKLCPHLHIPLQSGDTNVLARMNRPYNQEFYLERCAHAYSCIPNLAITSDIMVGFPGEDGAAFESTLDVVRKVGYARAHIFRFSARPNTPAADMPDHISDTQKSERAAVLAEACRKTQRLFVNRHIGRSMDVLVEGKDQHGTADAAIGPHAADELGVQHAAFEKSEGCGTLLSGYTGNYIRVQFTGGSHLIGTLATVRLIEPSQDGAIGEVGGAHFGPQEAPPDADFLGLSNFEAQLVRA
jgi:threonylcarbamoyladenosine tRNA methylthiotransferase MtaB